MLKRLNPRVDVIFKRLFGSEENKDILLSFLNAVFNRKESEALIDIDILNPDILPEYIQDKHSVLDVKART
jgi:predicted transposase/invertase (TIGR01784 family)